MLPALPQGVQEGRGGRQHSPIFNFSFKKEKFKQTQGEWPIEHRAEPSNISLVVLDKDEKLLQEIAYI